MNEKLKAVKEFLKKAYDKFKSLDKKKRAYIIGVLVFVSVMLWAFISAGIITSNFNRSQLKDSKDDEKVDAIGIIITETKEGKKYFEIYGENGNYNNDRSVATLHNVIGNFYKDGEVGMSFQSSKGTYDEKTGMITLFENTYIVLKDGISLNADRLMWSGSDKDTIAEGNVIIKKDKELTSIADQAIIGPDYKKIKIIGKTKTSVWSK